MDETINACPNLEKDLQLYSSMQPITAFQTQDTFALFSVRSLTGTYHSLQTETGLSYKRYIIHSILQR